MSKKEDGGRAFPNSSWNGMSIRDWFAGQALAGLSAGWWKLDADIHHWDVAEIAYALADAMLKAREG